MRDVVWTYAAESDLQSLFDEFESKGEGTGEQFFELIDSALELLKQFPQMAPVFKGPYRRFLLRDGRHGLFYAVEARGIILHAVADLRRDPEELRRRFQRFL